MERAFKTNVRKQRKGFSNETKDHIADWTESPHRGGRL
jgi:hypothetical protein